MNAESREKQFWLRVLLFAGMLWGLRLVIAIPFVFVGERATWFTVLVAGCNGLTILPATALAFWHRRAACIWLSLDAVLLMVALVFFLLDGGHIALGDLLGVSITIALAVCLDWYELKRWPMALGRG